MEELQAAVTEIEKEVHARQLLLEEKLKHSEQLERIKNEEKRLDERIHEDEIQRRKEGIERKKRKAEEIEEIENEEKEIEERIKRIKEMKESGNNKKNPRVSQDE